MVPYRFSLKPIFRQMDSRTISTETPASRWYNYGGRALPRSHDSSPIGSMVLYMVTWTPSIYPSHVRIYTSTLDPSWVMVFPILQWLFYGHCGIPNLHSCFPLKYEAYDPPCRPRSRASTIW